MYPNEPCPECENQDNDLPAPPNCGDVCAEMVDALCVNYTGLPVTCEAVPFITTGMSINAAIFALADLICEGVSGIASTITIGNVVINQIAYDETADGIVENSGTIYDAILDITLNIPQGVPGNSVNASASSTDGESITIASKIFTFSTPLVGPYNWSNGTRLRAFVNSSNYMEGIVTAHTANDVTINVDYIVGSGSHSTWEIAVAGDVGSQGESGTIDVTSPITVTSVAWNVPAEMTVTNTGTSTDAVFEFTLNMPAAVGILSASINLAGELVFLKDDGSDFNAGALPLNGVPTGGTTAQVLRKVNGTNYNTIWSDENTDGFLPIGGLAGQFLVKSGSADYVATWTDAPYLAPLTPGLPTGFPIAYVAVATESELVDAITQFNSFSGDPNYRGAIIKVRNDIALTQNHSLNFDGIEIHGERYATIDFQSGATNYYFEVLTGDPIFKNIVFTNTFEKVSSTPKPHKVVININNVTAVPSIVQFINCTFKDIAMGNTGTGANIILTQGAPSSELIFDSCIIQSDPEVDVLTPTHTVKLEINSISSSWEGAVTIKGMRWSRTTNKGQGQAPAVITPKSEISSIYFNFSGTWGTSKSNLLNIDMESYAYSTLNSKFGVSDIGNVYIMNSVFMYGNDDSALGQGLKPNTYGAFGWNNLGNSFPIDTTDY